MKERFTKFIDPAELGEYDVNCCWTRMLVS
jgi:hypothetical protein